MAICITYYSVFPRYLLCAVITTCICFLLQIRRKKHNFLMLIHPLDLLLLPPAEKYPVQNHKNLDFLGAPHAITKAQHLMSCSPKPCTNLTA